MEWIAAWLVLTVVFMWLTGGAHTRRLIAGVMPATPPRFSTGGREGVLQEFLAGADTESLEYPDVSNLLVDLRRADSRSDTSLLGARRLDELVSDLRTALTAHEREPIPPGAVWKEPCGWGLFGETKSFAGESPIDPEALTAVAGDYLKTPLVQSNLFEHYLLVGFLFDAIARGHHNMLRQQDGRLNVAYELANGNMTLMLVYRTGFLVAGFLARWRSKTRPQRGGVTRPEGGGKPDRSRGPPSIPRVCCGTPEGCIEWNSMRRCGAACMWRD